MSKGVVLTPCGASLLAQSQKILTDCRRLDRKINHLEEDTPINIISSITIASFLLPQILNELKTSFPSIQTVVQVASANNAIELLQKGSGDIAFWEGIAPKGDFHTIRLGTYRLCAACAPHFPIDENSLTPQQLCRYPLLLREKGSAVRDTFDNTLALMNLKVEPIWESVNSLTLIKAAEAGHGITILPEKLLSDSLQLHKLRLIPLTNITIENQMLALYHKDKYITEPFQRLIEHLKDKNEASLL